MPDQRILFSKSGTAKYISHLDLMHTMERAFLRAGITIRHTAGFHPHPYVSIPLPLPLGFSSQCELMEFGLEEGCTIIYAAVNGKAAGFAVLSDTPREDAEATVREIKKTGVIPVLLTGDHRSAASHIARLLGIEEVRSDCLPEDKLNYIDACQEKGEQVCMIGDGINDAPALKKAYVGIAMGGVGSDIAVDAADIALINDDIRELPHLLRLSRRMMVTIKCNLTFSMALNFIAIALAITGVLNPVVGALVHNAGSVIVIIHSAVLLRWEYRPKP